jgi:type VI secretion system protein ImpK
VSGAPHDPDSARDRTVIRPNPGGRRAPAPEASSRQPVGAAAAPAAAVAASMQEFVAGGRNRLLSAAGPLLTLGSRLQASVFQANIPNLRRQAIQSVRQFEEQAAAAGCAPEDVTVARYVLCTFVDSAVFRTPWGANGEWAGQSLLMTFHSELQGGEKFFQIAERLLGQPARYIDLLELQHVCLLLGFEGKYSEGAAPLAEVRERITRAIQSVRGSRTESALSPHWKGVEDRRNRVAQLVPWWVAGLAGAVVLLGAWILFKARLADEVAPLKALLAQQGGPALQLSASPPAQAGRLKLLLADAEARQLLRVEEFGAQSRVTLEGSEIFRSGSATLGAEYASRVGLIAEALEQVPGTVLVVGHTDDQPVRSMRYADNFELSRDRAVAVASLLRAALSNPARVEWTGLGDSQPIATAADGADYRTRNRRVEIIHTAATASAEVRP